jgi:hypothetical protein
MLKKIIILLLISLPCFSQLTVDGDNLKYNGKRIIILGATPANNNFHVLDFDLTFLDSMKTYGANHTWLMLENFYNKPWSYVKNTPKSFYDKLESICKKAYENDIIIGISIYGYGLINYPSSYSFNSACDCKGEPGPLDDPMDFYDINSDDSLVVVSREVQLKIIREVIKATWKYPNVYYSPGWEIRVIWNTNVRDWFKYISGYIKKEGAKIDPNIQHLIAIERTSTLSENTTIKFDFVIDEDANAFKKDRVPFVYWSTDGIYRNTSVWNNKLTEPKYNLTWMKQALIQSGSTASIWNVDPIEKRYLKTISYYLSQQDTINFNSLPDTVWFDLSLNLLPQFTVVQDTTKPLTPTNWRIEQ